MFSFLTSLPMKSIQGSCYSRQGSCRWRWSCAKERMRRVGLIRVLACWLALSAVLPAQQYVFRAFRQAEGLKNVSIDAMATDRLGFLWLGTENGAFKFLGSGFERYGPEQGIAEPYVLDMISDPDGAIWASSEKNLYRWDGVRFFPAGPDPIRIEGQRRMVAEDARHLLIVQNGRVYRLEHDAAGRMLSFLPLFSDHMLASMPDMAHVASLSVVRELGNGLRVWAGCGNGLCSWLAGIKDASANPHEQMVTVWGKDKGLAADHWEGVLTDRAGTLWAAGVAHVAVLAQGSARFVDRSIPGPSLAGFYSHAPLIEDPEGRILAPADGGIARWDGTSWRFIGRANGLVSASHIIGMAFDAAGDLWLASRGDGLYEWPGYADWEGWGDRQNPLFESIWAIVPSGDKRVFVGTERGPAWIDPSHGSSGPLSDLRPWPFGQVMGLVVERDGSLLGGTLQGTIFHLDPVKGRAAETAKLPELISRVIEDSSGRLFVDTRHGLFLSEPEKSPSPEGKTAIRRVAPHRVPAATALMGNSSRVTASCESPNGANWFGVNERLLRLQGGQWSAPRIDGMPVQNGRVYAMSCARDGTVWMVTAPGITWRLTPRGDRMLAWQLDPPPELRVLFPLAVLVDRRGWVWLGTDQGLLVWNGQNWRHLTQESGLIWDDVNQGVMIEASDGSLWIGTSGGVSHLLHPERAFAAIPLTVSLTELRRGETSYLGARQITIPWGGSSLHFRISSSTMRNRSELALKIRMLGFQPEWMDTTSGNATFSRLPPGKFTFMAMACNSGLNACSTPVQVDIRVLPPWWRTIWFYGLCFLALLLLLAAAGRLHARQLRIRSRQLEALVSERTRELEASREQLRIQATHDGLTGMLNRTAVLRTLTAEMERARRESRSVILALVDLDHFKRVNDSHGHLAGDDALRWFAAAVGAAIRPYDHAGRYGGEEFLLVLTELPREAVEQRLTRLHAAISNLQVAERGTRFTLNCSMGATVYDPSDQAGSVESLLAIADQALYAAKAQGRNRVVFRAPGALVPNP
jgi:diguanylate cyclase (GGDEF)-like protein